MAFALSPSALFSFLGSRVSSLTLNIIEAPTRHGDSPSKDLLGALLREQQATAVERFSLWHETEDCAPANEHLYRELIPLSLPGPGEQYAFEVDLDSCSGCKGCVVACHNQNGLEPDEVWRSVGLLHGGSSALPVIQHVTTACHHCLEPACLEGCPVEAYEKDPVTGIVRHLDDQCFGCQYCILKCPYDVPKYSHSKGIVRKCDMCHQRLAVGEAPACVQACPNHAIRIRVVNQQETADTAEANLFLPGAPEPRYTLPTTVYKTKKPLPANLLPADYFAAAPQSAHWPLVLMLIFTQMSVGAFVIEQLLADGLLFALGASPDFNATTRAVHLASAFVLGMTGLAASVFHLGRPWLAYRAILGWRKSWISREALAFGAFAGLASLYAALPLSPFGLDLPDLWERRLGLAVAVSGIAGVACSVMVYASTRRPCWGGGYTGLKFGLSCVLLGIPVALLIEMAAAAWSQDAAQNDAVRQSVSRMCGWLVVASLVKLSAEGAVFAWLRSRLMTPFKRTALLLAGELAPTTMKRFLLGTMGGVVLPGVLWSYASSPFDPLSAMLAVVLILLTLLAGEILERQLFFTASVAPKMPGAPAG